MSLQYCKLNRQETENVEEWIGRLCIIILEFKYKELDRNMKEQFINSLKDNGMICEIIKKLTILNDTISITREKILSWVRGLEVHRT